MLRFCLEGNPDQLMYVDLFLIHFQGLYCYMFVFLSLLMLRGGENRERTGERVVLHLYVSAQLELND